MEHRRVCRLLVQVDERNALYRPYGEVTVDAIQEIERSCLAKLTEKNEAIIDLRKARYIGADALHGFVRIHEIAKSIHKKVVFLTTPFQHHLLEITALDRVLETVSSLKNDDRGLSERDRSQELPPLKWESFSFFSA
jgi:hypothetical protein